MTPIIIHIDEYEIEVVKVVKSMEDIMFSLTLR